MTNGLPIAHIYTNGCSWTYGNGIQHDPKLVNGRNMMYHEVMPHAWPQKLGNIVGCNVINEASGGGSNHRMVRMTCDFLKKYPANKRENLLVILGWTSLERDEIYLTHDHKKHWINFNSGQDVSTSHVFKIERYPDHVLKDLETYQTIYRQHVQNTYSSFIHWIDQVYMLSSTLSNLGVRFLFFSSIGGWKWGNGYDINIPETFGKHLNHLSDDRFLGMGRGFSMQNFCIDNKIQLSPCHHPMIDGHTMWAKYLHSKMQEIYR
jgi:hypothetical protein